MGWTSIIEDFEKRLNDDFHLRDSYNESQLPELILERKRLYGECEEMLGEMRRIQRSFDVAFIDPDANVAELLLELLRERTRKENLSKALSQEQSARRLAEQKCEDHRQRALIAEKRVLLLDENAVRALKQENVALRSKVQAKDKELANFYCIQAKAQKRKRRTKARPAKQQQPRSTASAKSKASSR